MQRETEVKECQRSRGKPRRVCSQGSGHIAGRTMELPLDLALMTLRKGASEAVEAESQLPGFGE